MKNLFIFVEGLDDVTFFNNIFKLILEEKYYQTKIITWSCETKKKINNYIKTIKSMNNEIIFQSDFDNANCYTEKKNNIIKIYKYLNNEDIIITKMMIESWYIAGLDVDVQRKLKLKEIIINANEIRKDKFNTILPDISDRSNLLIKMLNYYDVELACKRNDSFNYFCSKWIFN